MFTSASPQPNPRWVPVRTLGSPAPFRRLWVVVLSMLALLLGGLVGPASAAKKSVKCDPNAGWAFVGRPANLSRLGAEGIYVWVEKGGAWRVSTTHANRRVQRISGSMTFDAPIAGKPTGSEGTFGDVSNPSANVVNFSFANYGGVDGISVSSPCSTSVSITAIVDDVPVVATQMFVGAAGVNPTSVPLVLARTGNSSAAQPGASNVGASSAVVVTAITPTTAGAANTNATVFPPVGSPANPVLPSTPSSAVPCSSGGWPTVLAGRPKVLSAKAVPEGVYLWVEKNVLKVQAILEGAQAAIVAGRISANATVTVVGAGLEGKRDPVKSDGSTVSFSLRVLRSSDGFELTSLCATQFVVEATIDDAPAPLFLGANAAPIPAQPYLVAK